MSISSMMNASTSGMAGQANRLAAVSDNIANLDTVGYKRAKVDFSTLVLPGTDQEYSAGGLTSTASNVISEQGTLKFTSSPTDLAITGEGFFVVGDGAGATYLTRVGSFVPDSEGVLTNSAGFQLLGYPSQLNQSVVVNGTAGLVPVSLATAEMQSTPTTSAEFVTNLPADATVVAAANLPSANAASAEYSGKTSLVVFDNVGRPVTLDIYLTKVAAESWEVSVYDQDDAASASAPFPYASAAISTETLAFDSATGQLTGASPNSMTFTVPNGSSMQLNLAGTSQLAADYTVLNAQANGTGASVPSRVEIAEDGSFQTIYEDGTRVGRFRIPLATVASPDNLETSSGNLFSATKESGTIQIGFAGGQGYGSIISGALEGSTVEVADELTSMIQAERNYTANSKVFQTSSELMEVLVNLKR